MRWLIVQSDGEHKGQDGWSPNWFLRECYSLQDALKRNGEEADIWGLRHANYEQTPDFNSYDAILLAENYEFSWIPDFTKFYRPLFIQWIIDLHWQPWNVYLPWAERMNIVLHSTSHFIEPFKRQASKAKHLWFPNAIDDRYFTLGDWKESLRPHDCVFIGGSGPRRQAITNMVNGVGMAYAYGITGQAYVDHLRRAKIGFNKNIARDINYRTFEVPACGACLLTQRDPDLQQLGFVDGTNCVLYESDEEAVRLAKELLSTGRWEEIGRAGYALSKRHSYAERIKLLLSAIP